MMRDADGHSGGGPSEDGISERRVERLEEGQLRPIEQLAEFRVEMQAEFGRMHAGFTPIRKEMAGIRKDIADTRTELASTAKREDLHKLAVGGAPVKGSISRIPTALQTWTMAVPSWVAGAGIVALALRAAAP